MVRHCSQRVLALEYVTIESPEVVALSKAYIEEIGYNGFGALWWVQEESTAESRHLLLDFNARLERHACISSVLPEAEKHLDPCIYFALGLDHAFQPVPAGHFYTDPLRLSAAEEESIAKWNVRHDDTELMEWIIGQQKKKRT